MADLVGEAIPGVGNPGGRTGEDSLHDQSLQEVQLCHQETSFLLLLAIPASLTTFNQ